jgi:hypothetical protein
MGLHQTVDLTKQVCCCVLADIPSSKLTWLWKITMFHTDINYKWPCSIAMINYRRVLPEHSSTSYCDICKLWYSTWKWVDFRILQVETVNPHLKLYIFRSMPLSTHMNTQLAMLWTLKFYNHLVKPTSTLWWSSFALNSCQVMQTRHPWDLALRASTMHSRLLFFQTSTGIVWSRNYKYNISIELYSVYI